MVSPSWESFKGPNQKTSQSNPQIDSKVEEEVKEDQNLSWDKFKTPQTYQGPIDPTSEENGLGYMVRHLVTGASRLGEQYLGRYGNAEKFGKDILKNIPASAGFLGYAISELVGPENWEKLVNSDQQIFPTSEQLKEVSKNITGGYTKPKTKGEEKFYNIVEDVGSTLRRGNVNPRQILQNNIGIPITANVAKEIVESTGFGEDKANIAKGLVWTGLTLAGNINAPQYASNLMNEGRNGIPNSVHVSVPRFQNDLNNLLNSPRMLLADPRSAMARQQIAHIQQDMANGQTSVIAMMNSYDGLNAAKRSRGMFELGRNDRNFARGQIDEVRNLLRDEIVASSGQYPQAINSWQNGVRAWASIHRSNGISNWVRDLAQGPYAKILAGPASALFGLSSYGLSKLPLVTKTGIIAGPAVYKGIQIAFRVINNPELARYYFDALGNAITENSPAFINNYLKLNKKLEKSETTKEKAS
jgi:hypothetical protein